MLTKEDFQLAISQSIDKYAAVAPLYYAKDPRILQHLDAIATMFGMLSAQIEVAMSEPFAKTRDATVLADAAMRGIVRKATPAKAMITATSSATATVAIEIGRRLIDSEGKIWVVETPLNLAGNSTGTFSAKQIETIEYPHTISESLPFYAIPIPDSEDALWLAEIAVYGADRTPYVYRERYTNTLPGEKIFHVEADDRQQVYVRFGMQDIVGTQPIAGDVFTLAVSWTAGDGAAPETGSPFSFEYITANKETKLLMTLQSVTVTGQPPISMNVLRELAKYPSVYDHNAVFLGEFDFLVRRSFPNLKFLSVWNERAEEAVRGANIDNINTLFVACFDQLESILTQSSTSTFVAPQLLSSLSETQNSIKEIILSADDSYRVKFYTPVISTINMTITATIGTPFITSIVEGEIRSVILAEYGIQSYRSSRGQNNPLFQQVYSLLKQSIPALSSGNADFTVTINKHSATLARPEVWRYVSESSLTVTVESVSMIQNSWGS